MLLDKIKSLIGTDRPLFGTYTVAATVPRKNTGDYLKSYGSQPWLRAAESRIGDGVASVQWKVLAIKKGNRLSRPGKSLSMNEAVDGGGQWYTDSSLQSSNKSYRDKYTKAARQAGELVEILDHPMLSTLHGMNRDFTGYQVRKLITVYLDIVGEAPLLKERNAQGTIIGLWPLPPHWVTETPTMKSPFFEIQFGGSAGFDKVAESEILWMVDLDPFNPYGRGSGLAMSMGDELDIAEFMAKYQRAFFLNSARPEFIVEIDKLGGPQTRKMEQSWNAQHQGFWKSFKSHFINRPVKIHTIGSSFKDQQLKDMSNLSRDHIAQIIGIPPEKLGIIESSNRATSEAADLTFTKDVILPRVEFQRQIYQERLVPEYDSRLVLDYESPVPADTEFQLKAAEAQPHNLSVDEWRTLTGHGALPDGGGEAHVLDKGKQVISSFRDML